MYAAPKIAPGQVLGPAAIVARALVVGAACGLASGALAGVPYWTTYSASVPMDWTKLAVVFFLFSLGTGACIGVGTAAGILMVDRLATRYRGAGSAFAGATIGGALVGTIPGAFGAAYFGGQNAPFMGTAVVAVLPFGGVLALSALVADIDRRAAGVRPRLLTLIAYAVLTLVPFVAAGVAFVAYVGDEGLLRAARGMLPSGSDRWMRGEEVTWSLAALGLAWGSVLGGALGAHVGATTALARLRNARAAAGSQI